jgi:hypothetical protein
VRLSKIKLFFFIHVAIALMLAAYFSIWLFGNKITADVIPPHLPGRVYVQYRVEGELYQTSFLRNDLPFLARKVSIRYPSFDPSYSRINSFLGIYAEPLGWWLLFFLVSAMLLLTNNPVFSKGTNFYFRKKFPWVSMEEYFPLSDEDYQEQDSEFSRDEKRNSGRSRRPPQQISR